MFESFFKLKQNNTNFKTEVLAGITTFMTMAYILIVNPSILSQAGMNFGAVFTATAIAAIITTILMALYAKLPFAAAPGMGLNAFFAFTIVKGMGYSWQFALTAVLLEGLIFILLTIFNVREAIINCIPINIKRAISVGIGLFIAVLGLDNAHIIVHPEGGTIVALGNLKSPYTLLALVGILITSILVARRFKGALLIGILITTVIGIPLGVTKVPASLASLIGAPPSIGSTFMKFEWNHVLSLDMFVVLFTLLFMDMFDTIGTLVGVATKANMIDENGNVPRAKHALLADAIGTTVGACLGTSAITAYVESASGVAEGGRTGLTALSTAFMFIIALFLSPLFAMIPSPATAPALVLVGLFMLEPIKEINLGDFTEAIPAFITMIIMPLSYSISDGIALGMISYVLIKVFSGKAKEVNLATYIISALFLLKFFI